MHVGLNLMFLVPGETGGMETYARELLPRLAREPGLRLTAFVNRETADVEGPWAGTIDSRVVPVHARNRIEWVRGEQQYLPRLAAATGCDLIHSLGSTAPLYGRVPRITTIHDLNYAKVPDAHFGIRGLGMRVLVPASARRSRRIVVDAASTRDDLVQTLGVAPAKVDVVPLGIGQAPPRDPGAAERARVRYGLGDDQVVLSVSAKRPHKNLARLLEAVASLPPERQPRVVLPGYPTPYEGELRALAASLGVADRVVWPAWVSDAELEDLYAAATCLVFPSLYEGFGLPVLEAMARGVPVATSGRASLAEVAGDAALLFEPEDVGSIAAAITRLLDDAGERERLARAGRDHAAGFTWEQTAGATVQAYRRTLGG